MKAEIHREKRLSSYVRGNSGDCGDRESDCRKIENEGRLGIQPRSRPGERRGFLDQFRIWANAGVKHKLFDRLEHGYSSTGDGFLF
jgi:hypothetical protein